MPRKKTTSTPTEPKEKDPPWEEAELRAAVLAYLDMQRKRARAEKFVKTHVYEGLAARFPRTAKAFELRMQNISYVRSRMGLDWLPGLKPAKNVGRVNFAIIERIINTANAAQPIPPLAVSADDAGLNLARQISVQQPRASYQVSLMAAPKGVTKPRREQVTVEQIARNEKVRIWLLKHANGHCECCGAAAPFISDNGEPYLEIHHVRQLAHGGPDTPANAVAVCPNCHRKLHFGDKDGSFRARLYAQVARLVPA